MFSSLPVTVISPAFPTLGPEADAFVEAESVVSVSVKLFVSDDPIVNDPPLVVASFVKKLRTSAARVLLVLVRVVRSLKIICPALPLPELAEIVA